MRKEEIKLYIITQENCPKCDYVKKLLTENPIVEVEFIDHKSYPAKIIKQQNIKFTPTIIVMDKNGNILTKIEKGMTIQNITNILEKELGIDITGS